MGACASKFTLQKNSSAAPLPDVKQDVVEVESREVNLVEEAVVGKDDALAVEDEINRGQSLGEILQEVKSGEVKKCSAEDVSEVKAEVVADAPAHDGSEKAAPIAVEEEILVSKNVEIETDKKEEKPAEAVKVEEPVENKAVEVPCADKEPEVVAVEKTEVQKPEELKKEEVKTPAAQESEKTVEQKPASDAEKKEKDEKSTEAAKIEVSEKKPASPEVVKTEELKQTENTKIETSDRLEDKHVLEPLKTEIVEKSSEEKKPVSDAEKPKAEEVKANK